MHDVLRPAPDESDDISRLHDGVTALCAKHSSPRLVDSDGTDIPIPASVFAALTAVLNAMSLGHTITLRPGGQELTTQEAADLLMVSRPHLVKLLDRGDIAHHRVGRNRRVRVEDVLEYQANRRVARREGLAELAQDAQDMGGYDA